MKAYHQHLSVQLIIHIPVFQFTPLTTVQDVKRLSELCSVSQALQHLVSITLTVETRHPNLRQSWTQEIASLLSQSPLEFFHVSSLGGELSAGGLDDEFCTNIVTVHGARLRRFSVHRLRMTLEAVKDICTRCPNLEQLFVVLDMNDLVSRTSNLSCLVALTTSYLARLSFLSFACQEFTGCTCQPTHRS